MCPNGLFFSNGAICEKCTGAAKELNCIINNCEGSVFKSIGYALRNAWARSKKYYAGNIDAFLCLTEFQKSKLIANQFNSEKCFVIPNFYSKPIEAIDYEGHKRKYVAFAGRISPEKGLPILLDAAKNLPEIKFKLAGAVRQSYKEVLDIPPNVELLGMLDSNEMKSFYKKAKLYLHTSVCYEGFPMVFPEAMAFKLPIIAPKMAGYPEIAEDEFNGLLFEPENSSHLTQIIKKVYDDNEKLSKLGQNGFNKLKNSYTKDTYYSALNVLYKQVLLK